MNIIGWISVDRKELLDKDGKKIAEISSITEATTPSGNPYLHVIILYKGVKYAGKGAERHAITLRPTAK